MSILLRALLLVVTSCVLARPAISNQVVVVEITQAAMRSKSPSGRLVFDFVAKEYKGRGLGKLQFRSLPEGAFEATYCDRKLPFGRDFVNVIDAPARIKPGAWEECVKRFTSQKYETAGGGIYVLTSPDANSELVRPVLELIGEAFAP
jgi:hypothetical protein